MKVFILEDSDSRIEWFKQHFPNADIAKTAKEAYIYLENEYDLIFLDHDLGGEILVDSNKDNTGYQVAKFISSSINKNTETIIHTLNPCGAQNMKNALPHARYIPYIMLKF
jgi:hypothetical protein